MIGIARPTGTITPLPSTRAARPLLLAKRIALLSTFIWGYGLISGFESSLSLLFVVGLLLAVRGLQDPVVGLLGVSIVSTIDAPARHYLLTGGLFRWNTFNYWLLVVIVLHVPFLLRLRDLQTRLLELFVGLLLLQLVVTPDWINGTQHTLGIISFFGLVVYFVRAYDPHKHQQVVDAIGYLNGTVAAVGSFVFFAQMQGLPYINPNVFSHFPLLGLISVVLALELRIWRNESQGNWIYYLLATLNYAWVFLSASRGNILIALVVVVPLLLRHIALRAENVGRLASLGGIVFLTFFVVMTQFGELQAHTVERIEKLFDTRFTLESRTSGRAELVEDGIEIFQKHPLGVGTGAYASYRAQLYPGRPAKSAHAGWIKILAENGALGLVLFAWFIVSFTISGWQRRRGGLFLVGMLATLVLIVALISTEFQSKTLWFVSAWVLTLLHHEEMTDIWQGALYRRPVDLFGKLSRP